MNCDDFILRPEAGAPGAIVLPGWATDWRIFDSVDFGPACARARTFMPARYEELLERLCSEADGRVTLVGWSLGGFAAAGFAKSHPSLVARLVLAGVRQRYVANEIGSIRRELETDKATCLRRFYRRVFLPAQEEDYRRFRASLLDDYLASMPDAYLSEGLDYLERAVLDSASLPACPIDIIHGVDDAIAPVAEARALAAQCPNARLHVVPGAGHAAILAAECAAIITKVCEGHDDSD